MSISSSISAQLTRLPGLLGDIFRERAHQKAEDDKRVAHLHDFVPRMLDMGYDGNAIDQIIAVAEENYLTFSSDQWEIAMEQIARRPDLYGLNISPSPEMLIERHRKSTQEHLVGDLNIFPTIASSIVDEIISKAANTNDPKALKQALKTQTEATFKEKGISKRRVILGQKHRVDNSPTNHLRIA